MNYRVDGTPLTNYCDAVRLDEGVAPVRGDRVSIPYEHGAYTASRHWSEPRLARLETIFTGASAAVRFQNLHDVTRLLMAGQYLQRSDPDAGEVRTRYRIMDGVTHPPDGGRQLWAWPIWMLDGAWEDAAESTNAATGLGASATIGPLAIDGTHPTAPKFTITCTAAGDDPKLVRSATGEQIYLPGSYATSDVIVVDCWDRTVTLNGARHLTALSITRGWWVEFAAGASVSFDWTSTSGTWSVTTAWRNRWH